MLKNKVFYKNDVFDKILMVLPRASDKVLNNLKGLPLCELITFETTPFFVLILNDSVDALLEFGLVFDEEFIDLIHLALL